MQINKTNIVIIEHNEDFNEIKLYREGDLVIEYKDHKLSNNTFVRTIENKKYTFKNSELTHVENKLN